MRKIWRLICLTAALVLVLALGSACVEPGSVELTLAPGDSATKNLEVTNNEPGLTFLGLHLQVDEEFSDWVSWTPAQYDRLLPGETKKFRVTYKVPLGTRPGDYEFFIYPDASNIEFPEGPQAIQNGLSSEQNVTIHVVAAVKANFSAAPTAGEAPLTVQFRDMSTGNVTSWHWNFGDGTTSSERFPAHIYTMEGIFGVSLTVKGPGGQDTISKPSLVIIEDQATPARLSVRNLNINPAYPRPRQQIAISAEVANTGGGWGSQAVNLKINGQVEQSLPVGVAAGTAHPVNFTVYKVDPGQYTVDIDGVTGTFTVLDTEKAAAGPLPGGVLDTTGVIAIVVIGVVVVGGAVTAFLMRRP